MFPLFVWDVNILEGVLGVPAVCLGREYLQKVLGVPTQCLVLEYLAGNFRCSCSVFGT